MGRVVRAFEALRRFREKVEDPDAFLVAEIRPDRVNHDTLGPIAAVPSQYSTFRRRIDWLNTAGGFEGALDPERITAAASGTGASMRLMSGVLLALHGHENRENIKDPTGYVIHSLIASTKRYQELEDAAARGKSEIAERSERFEAANRPLVGAFDANKESSQKDVDAGLLLGHDGDEDEAGES